MFHSHVHTHIMQVLDIRAICKPHPNPQTKYFLILIKKPKRSNPKWISNKSNNNGACIHLNQKHDPLAFYNFGPRLLVAHAKPHNSCFVDLKWLEANKLTSRSVNIKLLLFYHSAAFPGGMFRNSNSEMRVKASKCYPFPAVSGVVPQVVISKAQTAKWCLRNLFNSCKHAVHHWKVWSVAETSTVKDARSSCSLDCLFLSRY